MSGRRGTKEGSIYRRATDGRLKWVGAVSIGGLKRKVMYGEKREEVAEKMKALLAAQQKGVRLSSSERLTVGAYLEPWLAGAKTTIRPSTHARYSVLVRKHLTPRLGRIALAKLSPADCSTAFAAMSEAGQAPRSIIQARAVLGRALKEAEISGLVTRNAARLARPPRIQRTEMRTFTAEQSRHLIDATREERLGALFSVALGSAAREGELLALRWADIDWGRSTIRIQRTLQRLPGGPTFGEPKSASSRRSISLGASAMEALKRHRTAQVAERLGIGPAWQDNDLVFCTEVGTPLDAGNVLTRIYYPALKRAGLPRLNFHAMRHTAATLLLEAGAHPKVVAERLGHSTPSLVMNVYSHVSPRMQQEATAALERVLGA